MATYNFPDHIKGDTFDGIVFTMQTSGTPMNLTSGEINFNFHKGSSDGPLKYTLSTDNISQIEITNGLSGIFEIKEQIIDFDSSKYCYHAHFTFPDGRVKTYLEGSWQINLPGCS